MVGGKGFERWGVEVGGFGVELGGVGEREGERLGAYWFIAFFHLICYAI